MQQPFPWTNHQGSSHPPHPIANPSPSPPSGVVPLGCISLPIFLAPSGVPVVGSASATLPGASGPTQAIAASASAHESAPQGSGQTPGADVGNALAAAIGGFLAMQQQQQNLPQQQPAPGTGAANASQLQAQLQFLARMPQQQAQHQEHHQQQQQQQQHLLQSLLGSLAQQGRLMGPQQQQQQQGQGKLNAGSAPDASSSLVGMSALTQDKAQSSSAVPPPSPPKARNQESAGKRSREIHHDDEVLSLNLQSSPPSNSKSDAPRSGSGSKGRGPDRQRQGARGDTWPLDTSLGLKRVSSAGANSTLTKSSSLGLGKRGRDGARGRDGVRGRDELPERRSRQVGGSQRSGQTASGAGEVGGMIEVDGVMCKVRAKRGCATHPRSIAERVRRLKISENMRKLADLVPGIDRQANTSDMLEDAIDYMKHLQRQLRRIKTENPDVEIEPYVNRMEREEEAPAASGQNSWERDASGQSEEEVDLSLFRTRSESQENYEARRTEEEGSAPFMNFLPLPNSASTDRRSVREHDHFGL